jgi:hypothetical protein
MYRLRKGAEIMSGNTGGKNPTGPVWNNKYGKPLRCECGATRMRGTQLCGKCNRALAKERMSIGRREE